MGFRTDIVALHQDGQDPATGILRGRATLAKEGVYTYSDGAKTWREYTPASVLTDRAWLDSLRLSPVTLNHPAAMVTADNAKGLAIGAIGDTVITVGNGIASPITIWDRVAADAAKTTHKEVSLGYHCETTDEAGTWNGHAYDSRQVRRVANHVALVDRGRHGPDVRVTFDGADNKTQTAAVATLGDLDPAGENTMADKTDKADDIAAALAAANTRADRAEAERDATKAKLDGMAKGDKCDNCGAPMKDGKFFKDSVSAELKARVALEAKAAEIIKDFKADGKTDRQIRLDCLAAMGVQVAVDKTDDYVTGRLDAEIDSRAGKTSAAGIVANVASQQAGAKTDDAKPVDANAAMRSAWGM